MIDDSIPWKESLLNIADALDGRRSQQRWSRRTNFLLERDIMTGAFAVRRLVESNKISDEVVDGRIVVDSFR